MAGRLWQRACDLFFWALFKADGVDTPRDLDGRW